MSSDWTHLFSFVISEMMRKSSLDLPVKPQDQERLITSAKLFSFFLNIAQYQLEPPNYNDTMNKIRTTFPAMKHDEMIRQFVENQRICLN